MSKLAAALPVIKGIGTVMSVANMAKGLFGGGGKQQQQVAPAAPQTTLAPEVERKPEAPDRKRIQAQNERRNAMRRGSRVATTTFDSESLGGD
jgi:hypothetical protein